MQIKPYLQLMRLDKPIGALLLLWPTLWALWIASHGMPNIKILIIFILGVFVMRSAGCVINDIADRKFDKHVKRTANRVLAAGIISVQSAVILVSLLLALALLLVLQLNHLTIMLAFVALIIASIYPLTKRWTNWPQLILGLAFAMPVPMAFAAVSNQLPLLCWLIYLIAVVWPLMYDTEYAMVDRADDLKIDIKSTAILFGKHDVRVIALLQIAIIILLIILGMLLKLSWIYFISLMLAASLFIYQIYLIKHREPQQCFKAFLNNQWVGMIVFIGLLFH